MDLVQDVAKAAGYEISLWGEIPKGLEWDDNYDVVPVGFVVQEGDEFLVFQLDKWDPMPKGYYRAIIVKEWNIVRRLKPHLIKAKVQE